VKAVLAAAVMCFTAALLVSVRPPGPQPLWPGSRYSQADRERAVMGCMRFLSTIAANPRHFEEWGPDLLWCFHSIATTAADARLRHLARSLGQERAIAWRRTAPLPATADADEIADFVFGGYAAERLGSSDDRTRERLREMAKRFTPQDFLRFDPAREPPPSDVPQDFHACGARNARGLTACGRCGARLAMQSRYEVWYEALITAYSGDRYGVTLGARYEDVLRWIPVMRPYQRTPESSPPSMPSRT